MENIKFYVVTALLVLAAGFLGYGAISSLRDPVYYVNNQTLATVGDINANVTTNPSQESTTPETSTDTSVEVPSTETLSTPEVVTTTATPTTTPPKTTTTTLSTNADIKSALQKISSGTVLKKGTSSGDDVKTLQAALNAVAKAGLPVNGTFGAQTEAAVKKFQAAEKLPTTGQVANMTIAALIKKL